MCMYLRTSLLVCKYIQTRYFGVKHLEILICAYGVIWMMQVCSSLRFRARGRTAAGKWCLRVGRRKTGVHVTKTFVFDYSRASAQDVCTGRAVWWSCGVQWKPLVTHTSRRKSQDATPRRAMWPRMHRKASLMTPYAHGQASPEPSVLARHFKNVHVWLLSQQLLILLRRFIAGALAMTNHACQNFRPLILAFNAPSFKLADEPYSRHFV
jgi:hypothetical protein